MNLKTHRLDHSYRVTADVPKISNENLSLHLTKDGCLRLDI